MSEVKILDPEATEFTANGTIYTIEKNLSIDRWVRMQELETELGFGVTYKEQNDNWKKVYNLINDRNGKIADIAVIAYNMSSGISKSFERQPQILKFCALYMNTEGEDRKTITDDIIEKKIKDWREEGLGIEGFFAFAASIIGGLRDAYVEHTQSVLKIIPEMLKQEEEEIKE